jgi:hypothetical protein
MIGKLVQTWLAKVSVGDDLATPSLGARRGPSDTIARATYPLCAWRFAGYASTGSWESLLLLVS